MPYFQFQQNSNIAAASATTITVNKSVAQSREPKDAFVDKHCITINKGTSTAGTITVTSTAIGGAAEAVTENGIALVVDFSSSGEPYTRKLEGFPVESFTFTPSGLNGGDDWDVTIISGF